MSEDIHESKNPRRNNGRQLVRIGLVTMALVLLGYSIYATLTIKTLTDERDQRAKQELIRSQLPAQSCGVLSPAIAKQMLGDDIKRNARTAQTVAYEDGCTYVGTSSSNTYASLVIATYSSQNEAADNFAKERLLRVESENRDPGSYGDEMYYSAGSFYILNDNQTYAVAASKEGITDTQQEAFSRQLLEKTIPNINL